MRLLILLLACCALLAQPREGFVNVPGGPVWYRIAGSNDGVPLLALHGGPGGTSCRLLALEQLPGQTVVVYDQLGSGRSGRPRDNSLWTVEHFVEELHSLRQQLGLKRMHLLGHSWGASLAAAYVVAKGTEGIVSLTLASPLLNTRDWIADADRLRQQLPREVQLTLRRHEAAGTTDSDEYRAAEAEYTRRFVRRKPGSPAPECAGSLPNSVIYQQMWGPSEFHATGSLKTFDVLPGVRKLQIPVLLMVGQYDEATPETAARYQKLIPGAKLEVIPEAAHSLFTDNPQAALQALRRFLGSR
jgi:proline iminopeptidase